MDYCQMAALYDFDYDQEENSTETHAAVDTAPKSETGLDVSSKKGLSPHLRFSFSTAVWSNSLHRLSTNTSYHS